MNWQDWENTYYKLERNVAVAWEIYSGYNYRYGPHDWRTKLYRAEYEEAAELLETLRNTSPTGSWLDVNE